MTKKKKLLLGSLGTAAAIVAVPVAVVACSSQDDSSISTKASSNLGWMSTGLWSNENPAPTVTATTTTGAKIPTDGIPNSVTTVGALSVYVTLSATFGSTSYTIPAKAVVSNIQFQNGNSSAKATISFSLGIFGLASGIAEASGAATSATNYIWTVTPITLNTGKDLSNVINNLPSSINSDNVNINIESANILNNENQIIKNVEQYIWLKDSTSNTSLGALIGTYTPESNNSEFGLWTWVYNLKAKPISIVSGKTIGVEGVPKSVTTLKDLAQYLNMPFLYQFNIPNETAVSVIEAANNSQTITIITATQFGATTYVITGTYANNSWTYSWKTSSYGAPSSQS